MKEKIKNAIQVMLDNRDFNRIQSKHVRKHNYIEASNVSELKHYAKKSIDADDDFVDSFINLCHDADVLRDILIILLELEQEKEDGERCK